MSFRSGCFGPCFGHPKAAYGAESRLEPVKLGNGALDDAKNFRQPHASETLAPDTSSKQARRAERDRPSDKNEPAFPSWYFCLAQLRSKLINIRGAPMRRIAEGAGTVAEFSTAGLVSIFGSSGADPSASEGMPLRWTALHSCGRAAAALPAGLQLQVITPGLHKPHPQPHLRPEQPDRCRPAGRPWEMPLSIATSAPTTAAATTKLRPEGGTSGPWRPATAGPSAAATAAPQPSLPQPPWLPPDWRQLLADISQLCPAPLWRALFLPLSLEGRPVGAMLLVLPQESEQQQQLPEGSVAAAAAARCGAVDGLPPAAAGGASAANGWGGGGGRGSGEGGLEGALTDLAECVAECCLAPVLPTVEQVCTAASAIAAATSLQELAALLTGGMAALLASELHLELVVRLALLPYRDSPTGVLFHAPAADRSASRSGALSAAAAAVAAPPPQSPRCALQGPTGALLTSTTTVTAATNTAATNIVMGSGGAAAAMAAAAVYGTQQFGSFVQGLVGPQASPPPHHHHHHHHHHHNHNHHQLQGQPQGGSAHRLGGGAGSVERPPGVAQAGLGPSSVRCPHVNGKRIVVAMPAGREMGGEYGSMEKEDDPSAALTPCQSTADNSLGLSWTPLMVAGGGGGGGGGAGSAAAGGAATTGSAGGGGGGAGFMSGVMPRASAATSAHASFSRSAGRTLERNASCGVVALAPASMRAGGAWKASLFATSSTLLAALLNGKLVDGAGAASTPSPLPSAAADWLSLGGGGAAAAAAAAPSAARLHLCSALVPDVPTWLQDAAQPNSDLFSIVRRAGVAGGLASLIALVAEATVEAAATTAAAPAVDSAAVIAGVAEASLHQRCRPATGAGLNAVSGQYGTAVRPSAVSSSGAARLAATAVPPPRLSMLGPQRGRGSGLSEDGFNSLLPSPPAAASSAAGGGGNGSSAAVGAGGASACPGTAIVGLYLYSCLSLPPSFLQAARERALGLMQVLAPVVIRSLHCGPMADDWSYLHGQVLGSGGGGGGATAGMAAGTGHSACLSAPAPLTCGLVPVPRTLEGLGGGSATAAASRTAYLTAAVPVDACGQAAHAITAAAAAAPRSAGGGVHVPPPETVNGGSAATTATCTASSDFVGGGGDVIVAAPAAFKAPPLAATAAAGAAEGPKHRQLPTSPPMTRGLDPVGSRSAAARVAVGASGSGGEPVGGLRFICSSTGMTSAPMSAAGGGGGGSLPPLSPQPAASASPLLRPSAACCSGGEPYDTAAMLCTTYGNASVTAEGGGAGDGDGGGALVVAAMDALGATLGTGMGLTGLGLTTGISPGALDTEWMSSMALLTNTVSDLGPVARQQNMATLVTAFTTTLSRARTDRELTGGTHAEDDIRNLRILRAIGLGGCSVVVLARLHAMPVAVKVILPLDEEEEGGYGELRHQASAAGGAGSTGYAGDSAAAAAVDPAPPAPRQSYHSLMSGRWTASGDGSGGGNSSGEKGGGGGCPRAPRVSTTWRRSRLQALMRGARELAVLTTISHPNIVQVYSYCTRVMIKEEQPGSVRLEVSPEGAPAPAPLCTALIMEYCDMGSLADCIDTGAFAKAARAAAAGLLRQQQQPAQTTGPTGPSSHPVLQPTTATVAAAAATASAVSSEAAAAAAAGGPAMCAAYLTLVEVALALRHLHSLNLVHCDVKPANVLLRSSATDPRGFTAKLTDFGFVNLASRNEAAAGGMGSAGGSLGTEGEDDRVGTVTHMAPELLQGSPLNPSVDIYSFGILMWEVYTGRAPYSSYAENGFAAVPKKVIKEGLRPKFPAETPAQFKILAVSCWSSDVARRPSASELVTRLQALLDASCGPQV